MGKFNETDFELLQKKVEALENKIVRLGAVVEILIKHVKELEHSPNLSPADQRTLDMHRNIG